MGKKRKVSQPAKSSLGGFRDLDPADARLGQITSFKDVADSEDDFFINQDRIAFGDEDDVGNGDGHMSKRRRRLGDTRVPLELSDDEVLAPGDDDDDDDEEEEDDDDGEGAEEAHGHPQFGDGEYERTRTRSITKGKKTRVSGGLDREDSEGDAEDDDGDDDGDGQEDAEEEDQGWWGSSKADYYNADKLDTEADALEEENEARRLQSKKLAGMAEEDFVFDEAGWRTGPADTEAERIPGPVSASVITEVLKDVSVPADMPPDERYKLLQTRYPEFTHLAQELADLRPRLALLRAEAEAATRPGGKTITTSLAAVRYWVAGCYVAVLASYFAILTSPARDGSVVGAAQPGDGSTATATANVTAMSPAELREHEVMGMLVKCRDAWSKVSRLDGQSQQARGPSREKSVAPNTPSETHGKHGKEQKLEPAKPAKSAKPTKPAKPVDKIKISAKAEAKSEAKAEAKAAKSRAIEASVADLYNLGLAGASKSNADPAGPPPPPRRDHDSDFGEEESLDVTQAAEKAAHKRSLRFYTSQIVQKANRRAGASRDAGGDADIPYRERFRDREARLNAAAERRGRPDSNHGVGLEPAAPGGTDDEDEDHHDDNDGSQHQDLLPHARGSDADDAYYNAVAGTAASRSAAKDARKKALAASGALDRVVEAEEVGADGKRRVTYAIEKNKGLTPRRKKEVRNPRVKQRERLRKRVKKLNSMRGTTRRQEGPGPYEGERTGITRAIKSVAL